MLIEMVDDDIVLQNEEYFDFPVLPTQFEADFIRVYQVEPEQEVEGKTLFALVQNLDQIYAQQDEYLLKYDEEYLFELYPVEQLSLFLSVVFLLVLVEIAL